MSDDGIDDTIAIERQAFALGSLALLRSFAAALMDMPLTQVERDLEAFDQTFPHPLASQETFGRTFYRTDVETVKILSKARMQLIALASARASAIEKERRKALGAARNSVSGTDRRRSAMLDDPRGRPS